ncbi:amino acid permease-domain-containing protein [Fusarium tricinctum]|uniref:Amino acid permease-domain-containing protein n=1 Tax=Fusarium tricinctum TaxID=61284 RepID=A0A8K0WE72_9HYPO|nr:amino acid permease-domain-containing protein [Fusarium tricinctum]
MDIQTKSSIHPETHESTPSTKSLEHNIETSNTELERALHGRHLQFIAIGAAVGTGLFIGTGNALATAGPVSLLIAFIFVGTLLFSVMTALGEMAAYIPVAGAFTTYATRFLDPTFGFAMGWIYWFSWSITFALELTAAGLIIQYWEKDLNIGIWIAVFWVLFTAANFMPVRWFGEFEMWFSSIKVVTIVGFIIFSICVNAGVGDQGYLGFKYWKDPGAFNEHLVEGDVGRFVGFWSVLVTAGFSYQGSELVAIGAGETKDPRKTIPSAMRWTFWGVFSIFIATVFFLGLNIPSTNKDLLSESHDASASPLVIVAQLAGVPILPSILNAVLLTAVLTAANSDVYSSSRILISLADSGHAPAFLKKTNRFGTPYNAVGVCAAVGFLSFLNLSNDGTVVFDWFLSITSVAGFIAWAIISLCHIRFMKALSLQGLSRSDLPYVAPFQPYLSCVCSYNDLGLLQPSCFGPAKTHRQPLLRLHLASGLARSVSHLKVQGRTWTLDMFENASKSRSRLKELLLLLGLVGSVWSSTQVSAIDRCPDYVANHAPLVWLHSEDRFMPSDLAAHVSNTIPKLDGEPISGPSVDLENLAELNGHGGEDVALTSKEDPLTYPPWILGEAPDASGRIHDSVPCAVILVEKSDVDIDAFYFYFYSYNEGPNITQVLEPIDWFIGGKELAAGLHFGNHVGDWEHNMVRFHNGTPVGVYYSQHVDGVGYKWDDSTVNITNGRPISYSALGSHANYAEPGRQVHNAALFDYCDEGKIWDPVQSAYFYRFDPTTFSITPIISPFQPSTTEPAQNLTSWFDYLGHWGDIKYPDSDPRQETVPHFGLKRFNSGPNGPRYKHLVRKGLVRDHARKMVLKEWVVGVFMAWYPCCIKGWRLWRSLGIMAVVMSGFVLAIIFGVRRYKTWRQRTVYSRLKEEDIPMEELRRDEEFLLASDDEDEEDDDRR